MISRDHDLEREVVGWCAEDPDARALFFEQLERRDFDQPLHRSLFTALRAAWRSGDLAHGFEIRGTEVVHVFDGITEDFRAELHEILESGGVGVYFPNKGTAAIARLRRLMKERAILAAAERVLAGQQLPDPVIEYLLSDDRDAAA